MPSREKKNTTTATVNDTALILPGDRVAVDTSTREVNERPGEEEIEEDEERSNQLKNRTEDPSYREKDLVAKQYILDEDEDLALRWAVDTINHFDCAI
ncbi:MULTISPECIES: hypothetical protein [unclassified Chitinophaga]|uniref:hypothetical protein n=1 Tax=unclassified Chitinophaga TaxID=2619133 RepID=UPI0009C5B811|nr:MULTISPECIES: hypothetical protein [unclassified Chitinophaga]OMP75428.1 hypothetical protein BW716_30265 [[Flexibacter] sp. ATCC 35208]WPV66913.1 hypothetical protein QQL36_34535 [Chitinophaga sp. LS1]